MDNISINESLKSSALHQTTRLVQTLTPADVLPPAVYESLTKLSSLYRHIEETSCRLGYLQSELETLKAGTADFAKFEEQAAQSEEITRENTMLKKTLPLLQNDALRAKNLALENELLENELTEFEKSHTVVWSLFNHWFKEQWNSKPTRENARGNRNNNDYYRMIRDNLK